MRSNNDTGDSARAAWKEIIGIETCGGLGLRVELGYQGGMTIVTMKDLLGTNENVSISCSKEVVKGREFTKMGRDRGWVYEKETDILMMFWFIGSK